MHSRGQQLTVGVFITRVVWKLLLICGKPSYWFFPEVFSNIFIVQNFYFISMFVYSFSYVLQV